MNEATTGELFEGNRRFALARVEGHIGEREAHGIRHGTAHLWSYDRSRDPRGLFLDLKLPDGRVLPLTFETWDARSSSGRVSIQTSGR